MRLLVGVVAIFLLMGCAGNDAARQARLAADNAAHTLALQGCLDKGKEAHSTDVYMACADDVDRRFGVKP